VNVSNASHPEAMGLHFAAVVSTAQPAIRSVAVGTVIVGGGPAGLAPLIAASRAGTLDRVLAAGVVVIDQRDAIGAGQLGSYAINSDSSAETIVNCVHAETHPALAALRSHPATLAVASHGNGPVPLSLVGRFMIVVGEALHGILATTPGCGVHLGSTALHSRLIEDGSWCTIVRDDSDGTLTVFRSQLVVLATGGAQPISRLDNEHAAGAALLPLHGHKLMQSGEVLVSGGLKTIGQRLADRPDPRIAIIGSSSSAIACAHLLLNGALAPRFGPGAISVLHRRPLRVFFPTAAEALAEGYDEFGPEDICPLSGFVFRFAGFRLESRELVMAARGIGGRPPEPRLRLVRLGTGSDAAARAIIDDADLLVAALGYRPRALPILSPSGDPIRLLSEGPGARQLVDGRCRVLDGEGEPIPGLLGLGLACGFVSPEAVGGEPSFSGQTNGLWQWQNDVGAIIAERIGALTPAPTADASP